MRCLLVDNSNTRTKFALASADALEPWRAVVPTAEVSEQSLRATLAEAMWDAAVISSVVPAKAEILSAFIGARSPCHMLGHRSRLPIGIDYPDPGQIGADRLANAAAAYAYFGAPCVVLDFGTAVTFDVIRAASAHDGVMERQSGGVQSPADDGAEAAPTGGVQAPADDGAEAAPTGGVQAPADDGAEAAPTGGVQAYYQGGVIAPGLASMTEGLARRTALLPHIELAEPGRAIGRSTEEAMLSGAVHGYRGLVREIIRQIRTELAGDATVVATGGDAALIVRGVREINHHCPQLTMDGLRIVAAMNC